MSSPKGSSRRQFLKYLGAAAVVAGAAGVSYYVFFKPPSKPKELPTLTFAYLKTQPHHANIYYMPKISEDYGFKMELVSADRYVTQDLYISQGSVNFGATGYADLIFEAAKPTGDWLAIAGVAVGAIGLVVRNDVKIETWKDLEGKKIGEPLNGFNQISLELAIGDFNVDRSKVNIIPVIPGPAGISALEKGEIDVMNGWETPLAQAVVQGIAYRPPINLGALPQFTPPGLMPNSLLAVNTKFASKMGDEFITNIVKALIASTQHLVNNKTDWVNVASQVVGLEPKIIEESLKVMNLDTNLYLKPIYAAIKSMVGLGLYTAANDPSPNVKDYITYKYLQAATGKSQTDLGWVPYP
jgi:ABC-type nitrate/sulfonate/bicarbonate transport system substrate-binding protein